MIERRAGPVFRHVTTRAVRSVLAFVDIVRAVTGDAGLANIGEVRRKMASITADFRMSAS